MNPKKAVKYALAHAAIVLSGMLMVLLAIDRVNEAISSSHTCLQAL